MDKKRSLQLIEKLSNANGVSGFEDEVVHLFSEAVKDLGEVTEDPMRNVYVRRRGTPGIVRLFSWTRTVTKWGSWYRQSSRTEPSVL
ncbi:hypothetical protein ABNN70_06815 [Sporolactobacillus sp. Y61]|uniref:Uncharacterized protein n=1 Tax=Sporolactobacillus sp. Y61 TaxID=3160863 RepID=A0AAU8IIH3_9BACL